MSVESETVFQYIIYEDFEFSMKRKINYVTFDISRYGLHTWTLKLKQDMTQIEAIREVEKWLSKPVTPEYLELVSEDLMGDTLEEYGEQPVRGDLLGDAKYLEELEFGKFDSGHITIRCGS